MTFDFPAYGIFVFTSRHTHSFQMPLHRSKYHELILVQQGHGQLAGARESVSLKPQDLIHIPPGKEHRFVDFPGDPLTLMNLCFEKNLFRNYIIERSLYDQFMAEFPSFQPVKLQNQFRQNRINQFLQQVIHEQTFQRSGYGTVIHSTLLQLLVFLVRMPLAESVKKDFPSHHYAVTACLEYMEAHFHQPVSIPQLAEMTPFTERRLATLFKQQTGQTMHQYLNMLRIEYAKKRLLETDNIIQTAFESGFNDLTTFYRVFKKSVCQTPRAFLLNSVKTKGI
jgi:AraC-like DNA-binding protein